MINDRHTSKQFDAELSSLHARVMQMGIFVENQVRLAIRALLSDDEMLLNRVIADDQCVNSLEVAIDEICCQIIARRQPTANDMRMVTMAVKTITDLERIGDEAKKIALMAHHLLEQKSIQLPRYERIKRATVLSLDMLHNSLDAFANFNLSTVIQVVRQVEQSDEEFRAIRRYLITCMTKDPRTISIALDILFIAKAIENIGDHAKNISEYVVYMIKGRDVRHVTFEEIKRTVQE